MPDYVLHHDDVYCRRSPDHLRHRHNLLAGKDCPRVYPPRTKDVHHIVQGR